MSQVYEQFTDEQIRDAEQAIAAQKREREHARWDAELVGRYFRVIRTPQPIEKWFGLFSKLPKLQGDDYVMLERSMGVGWHEGRSEFVYADVVFIHIQSRDDRELRCSGFEVSHAHRKEPYLKIQPVFYSYCDFRDYLNSSQMHTGPAKHCDEISKEEYETALAKAVSNFTTPLEFESQNVQQLRRQDIEGDRSPTFVGGE